MVKSSVKMLKVLFCLVCIISLIMPHSLAVFEGINAQLGTIARKNQASIKRNELHEGETGYKVNTIPVFKLAEVLLNNGQLNYNEPVFCIKAGKRFPAGQNVEDYQTYNYRGELKSSNYKTEFNVSDENFKALLYLLDFMYINHKDTSDTKHKMIEEAFASYIADVIPAVTIEHIEGKLSEDTIETVEQWAVWTFTDSETEAHHNLATMELSTDGVNYDNNAVSTDVLNYSQILYNYLVTKARNNSNVSMGTPEIQINKTTANVSGNDYKFGPIKIKSNGHSIKDLKITYVNGNNEEVEITDYTVIVPGKNNATLDDLVDVTGDAYITIPQAIINDNNITRIKIGGNYRETYYWTQDDLDMQPIVSFDKKNVEVELDFPIYDLALRKFITKVNGQTNYNSQDLTQRDPANGTIDLSPLKNWDGNVEHHTAIYPKVTVPVKVEVGDTVLYTIRIYNEGTADGKALDVIDYLPEGLEFIEAGNGVGQSQINSQYGWEAVEGKTNAYHTTYLSGKPAIQAFDGEQLYYEDLEIECKVVAAQSASTKRYKNIAEIIRDDGDDIDSVPDTVVPSEYPENSNIEDDDDWEIVEIPGKVFDLALRKSIVSYGDKTTGDERNPNAEGNIDHSKLGTAKITGNTRTETTADYYHRKDPLEVKNGDKVVYRIDVYNEGDIYGKALQITDFLPEGLKYVPSNESTINTQYGWTISEDGKSATTSYTQGTVLAPFNGRELSKIEVLIECYIDEEVEAGTILTNVAAITSDLATDQNGNSLIQDIDDRDSNPEEVPVPYDSQTYKGNSSNKDDLTDEHYFYKGQEDDDDFEKVKVIKDTSYDLALKKFIVKVNDTEITDRIPKVTIPDGLATDKNVHDAIYELNKKPVKVETGDVVLYTIRIYNEGSTDGVVTKVRDYLPEGLEFIEAGDEEGKSKLNKQNGWYLEDADKKLYATDVLNGTVIGRYDGRNELHYVDIQMEVKVTATSGATKADLTNYAEIAGDNGDDRDSTPGNREVKPGEDDDDYEIVVLKEFDLALQKFITKVNNKAITDRIPEPTIESLNRLRAGTTTDAVFNTNKNPVVCEIGDIVTYTIRVYNEGDIDGYADQISDYLPDGLGFIMNHKTNVDNYWLVEGTSNSIKLKDITNGTNNLKLEDFVDVTSLDNVEIVPGKAKITSTKLKYYENNENNLLKAFNKDNADSTLDYKDIEVACIFIGSSDSTKTVFRNVAEINKDLDKNGKEVNDRDSTPANVNPDTFDVNNNEDDDDYELITLVPKKFDMALRKFITKVDNTEVTSRIPRVARDSNGKIVYAHPKDPVLTANSQIVTYTIRVFNEGEVDGYAAEVMDDLPNGIQFLPEHETNKKYTWVMYDKDGNVTTDVSKAESIKTDYLSKEKSQARNDDALMKAYNPTKPISSDPTNPNPDYKDLQVAFKVTESNLNSDRIIINTAKVTKMTDKDGNPTKNTDESKLIDKEYIKVKYFDLELIKFVTKVIIEEDGVVDEQSSNYNGENDLPSCTEDDVGSPMPKVDIHKKKLDSTVVKFVYTIRVTNTGEIPGYATEITDYIPEGLTFDQEDNKLWNKKSDNVITSNGLIKTLLNPGESADIQVTLRWINDENNLGAKRNIAEISEDYNIYNAKDIDSTPNNRIEKEDDIDDAKVILSIITGSEPVYISLALGILLLIGGTVIFIKKRLM